MLDTVPDFAPYFEDAGPALRVRAGLLMHALGASCTVMVWNPRDTEFRHLKYLGRRPVCLDGYSMARVFVTLRNHTTYVAGFVNREPTATDVDSAVAGILEAVLRAGCAQHDELEDGLEG